MTCLLNVYLVVDLEKDVKIRVGALDLTRKILNVTIVTNLH